MTGRSSRLYVDTRITFVARQGVGDQAGRLDAVELAHVDVHQHEVGVQLTARRHGILTGRHLGDQLEPVDAAEHGAGCLAERWLVVDDHDADALGHPLILANGGAGDDRATTRTEGVVSPRSRRGARAPP